MPINIEASPITWETLQPIVDSMSDQITVTGAIGVIAGIAGLAIGFVFLWWAARKGSKALIKAFKTGKFGF